MEPRVQGRLWRSSRGSHQPADVPLEQVPARSKEAGKPPLIGKQAEITRWASKRGKKKTTQRFRIQRCPQPQSLLRGRLLPASPGSVRDAAFSTPWEEFFPFALPCTSPGMSARGLPALQNVPEARMPAPARLSQLPRTALRTFPGWDEREGGTRQSCKDCVLQPGQQGCSGHSGASAKHAVYLLWEIPQI